MQWLATSRAFAISLPGARIGNGIFYLLPLTLLVLQFWILRRSSSDGLDLMLHSLGKCFFRSNLAGDFRNRFLSHRTGVRALLSTWLPSSVCCWLLNRTPCVVHFFALQGPVHAFTVEHEAGTSSRARYNNLFAPVRNRSTTFTMSFGPFDARDPKD